MDKRGTGNDVSERIAYAKDLFRKIIADSCAVEKPGTGGDEHLPIAGLKETFGAALFDPEGLKICSDDKTVIWNPLLRTAPSGLDPEDLSSAQYRDFWFQGIFCWNDGQSVGFYFIKQEGVGSHLLNFNGEFDSGWFAVSGSRSMN
jgi:hypothetical protein